MNINKARDFYSVYYEGALEGGLKEAFERALANDPAIADEYSDFVSLMETLAEPVDEVATPSDLHEKIMARLDHAAWKAKEKSPAGWFVQLRPAFLGALALAAIGAAVLSLNNQGGEVVEAGLGGRTTVPTRNVELTHQEGQFELELRGAVGSRFSIRRVDTGEVLEEISLTRNQQNHPVANRSAQATPIEVVSPGGERYIVIVLPGTERESSLAGEGTPVDVARTIAGTFRMPVILRTPDSVRRVKWSFDKGDDFHRLSEKLKASGANLSLREDGIVLLAGF